MQLSHGAPLVVRYSAARCNRTRTDIGKPRIEIQKHINYV